MCGISHSAETAIIRNQAKYMNCRDRILLMFDFDLKISLIACVGPFLW